MFDHISNGIKYSLHGFKIKLIYENLIMSFLIKSNNLNIDFVIILSEI